MLATKGLQRALVGGAGAAAFFLMGCDGGTSSGGSSALPAGDDPCHAQTRVQVGDFVDGDTVDVEILDGTSAGATERVRLLNIDTPEIDHSDHKSSECYGLVAWNESVEQLQGEEGVLTFDAECRDHFGRWLAFLFRASDSFFLNQHLVEDGFARTLFIAPNTSFETTFLAIEQQAQAEDVGLWGPPCDGGTR